MSNSPRLFTMLFSLLCLVAACQAPTGSTATRWQMLTTGTDADLRGLHVVDAGTIWASGSGGRVIRSVDGGASFAVYTLPGEEQNEIRDVHAFDQDTAYFLACQPARIYRTTDGGQSFDLVLDVGDTEAFFDGLSFFDRAHGVVFGDPIGDRFLIYTTDDGGSTWERIPMGAAPAALPNEAGFAASGTCLTVNPDGRAWIGTGGGAARVLRSLDWGRTWSGAPTGMGSGDGAGVFSLAFRDRNVGVAVGGDYRPGKRVVQRAATTTDGGRSFAPVLGNPTRGYRSCVAFSPERGSTWLAVGPTGADVSNDDGHNWRPLGDTGFHVVAFAPDGTAFAAGSGGRVARLEE